MKAMLQKFANEIQNDTYRIVRLVLWCFKKACFWLGVFTLVTTLALGKASEFRYIKLYVTWFLLFCIAKVAEYYLVAWRAKRKAQP